MQEILARPGNDKLPLPEQEFYELRLDESADAEEPGFIVSQWHYLWSDIDKQFMFDDWQSDDSAGIEQAKRLYEVRRRALIGRGFNQSDMDL